MLNALDSVFSWKEIHQIPVLAVNHPAVTAQIALQGAQLLSWQPAHCSQEVLWLSEVEPFVLGTAIRGGVPICYPWFGGVKQPAHGTARLQLWQLTRADSLPDKVVLIFELEKQAQLEMVLGDTCELTFTHLGDEPAQVALHSYFNVADISQIELHNLPTETFNSLTQRRQAVSSPRKIAEGVDEIYTASLSPTAIVDPMFTRQINVAHRNASDVVVWNPWHKATSAMSETGFKTMVCVETARIHRLLEKGEQLACQFSVNPL